MVLLLALYYSPNYLAADSASRYSQLSCHSPPSSSPSVALQLGAAPCASIWLCAGAAGCEIGDGVPDAGLTLLRCALMRGSDAAMMPPPPPPPPGPRGAPASSARAASPGGAVADAAVQSTNDDATVSKLSAVMRGYWDDPFLQLFVRRPQRRPPLINRGYYARVAAIRQLLLRFLAAGGEAGGAKQVVSLGAGFDTTAFALAAAGASPCRYAEVDFKETTARKAAVLARQPELIALLAGESGAESVSVHAAAGAVDAPRYALRAADLRAPDDVAAALASARIDPSLPTLVLLECVLVYMEPSQAAALLAWAAAAFRTAAVVVYDPTRPDDAFGKQMLLNLAARGCPLRGIGGGTDPEAHAARLRAAGWGRAECVDMLAVYDEFLDAGPRAAAERREPLDELEEWVLIQRHYALALGVNDPQGLLRELTLAPAASAAS